jgi:hypothetical protein
MKFTVHLFLLTLALSLCATARAQSSTAELENLFIEANNRRAEYIQSFRNLIAEEAKTIETFDENGQLERRRVVVSDLIVYEARQKVGELREYRNVRTVDGKEIEKRDKRAVRLFEKLADADSLEEELERIGKESLRYDVGISYNGFTLFQAGILADNVRSSFVFEIAGGETMDGGETIVLNFRQASANPNLNVQIKAPDYMKLETPLYRGTLWLDARSKKIRQLRQELIGISPLVAEPLIILREEFFYRPADDFKILLPTKIVIENFGFKVTKSVRMLLQKNVKVKLDTFLKTRYALEYKNFKRFDVKAEAETKSPQNQR